MGKILSAKCSSCDYERQLYIGGSMWDLEPDNIASSVQPEYREEILERLSEGASASVTRVPYVCPHCGEIYVLSEVRLNFEGKTTVFRSRCPACGKEKRLGAVKDIVSSGCTCPSCGAAIEFINNGMWD